MSGLPTTVPVAVVGMACRLPGAPDLRAYWRMLREGTSGITHFDPAELLAKGADGDYVRRPGFVPAMGVLSGSYHFDWAYFGYSRAEAANIDPQQRVFLQCVTAALDDAGIDPTRFPGWIGVYAGSDKCAGRADDDLSELARYIGQEKDFLATRVAYKLGLRGPAVTVQTACSTSLTATHMAAAALRGGECDVALAGGVAVTAKGEWGYQYEPGGILSPDGCCRPFDENAEGTVPSEGVGVVVLKRLEDALRDGDRVIAVIRGSAINNDGSDKMGYTAPSIPGQSDVIRYAQAIAGADPADIGYVEAHGTATRIGDPVEVQALTDAFAGASGASGASGAAGWCRLGAVKSNLGHTGSAAGVAGLIKTALMLQHRELVPTVHYRSPNPLLELDATPFRVATAHEPWPEPGPALAAVSSFGVGGTNAHVILEGPPRRTRRPGRAGARVLVLSAASPRALDDLRHDLAGRLREDDAPALPEVARTLADRRVLGHRRAFVASSPAEAAAELAGDGRTRRDQRLDRVAFLFPGHGPMSHAAGAAAYRLLPGFREHFDEIRDVVRREHGVDLSPVVGEAEVPGWFSDIVHHHLGLFSLGYALGRQLAGWGVTPIAMLGNSVGEYAPAALAGVWAPAEAAGLVFQRAAAMAETEPGRMVAVNAPPEEIRRRLGDGGEVGIAVVGTGGVVLSGPEAEVDAVLAGSALRGLDVRPLDIRQASHCRSMDPAAKMLGEAVAAVPGRAPRLRVVSNATGTWADEEAVRGPGYWAGQLRSPVQLDGGMGTLLDAGCDTFLELGPGTSMIGALRRHRAWDPGFTAIPMLGRPEDGESGVLRAIAALWEHGADEALAELDGAEDPRPWRCSLPTYPFSAQDPELEPETPVRHRKSPPPAVGGGSVPAVLERLWCASLGVAAAADGDNFFALGGESLMVVNLLSKVREQTGISLSTGEFSQSPTFGTLRRLADERKPASEVVAALPLRAGSGRPLLLVADSVGSALSYTALAQALGGDQPVYGLEPVEPATLRTTVEELAAHHVDAAMRVQPEGPYTLAGWSFGAVLAHEMARQLVDRGAQVDLVACLDAFVQGRRGVPIGFDPEFLTSHAYLQLAAALRVGPVGTQARRNPALRALLLTKAAVLARYRPKPVDCRAVVFRVGVDGRAAERLRARLSPLYRGVAVEPIGGDHWSMLAEPHVAGLAARLQEALTPAERAEHVS